MGGKPLLAYVKPDFPAVVIGFSFKFVAYAYIVHMGFFAKQQKYEASWFIMVISKD